MSLESICKVCGAEYDTRHNACPQCDGVPFTDEAFPDECPIFQMLADGPYVRSGAIVQGVGTRRHEGRLDALLVHVLDLADVYVENLTPDQLAALRSGAVSIVGVQSRGVRALTWAAVAMQDLVTP